MNKTVKACATFPDTKVSMRYTNPGFIIYLDDKITQVRLAITNEEAEELAKLLPKMLEQFSRKV